MQYRSNIKLGNEYELSIFIIDERLVSPLLQQQRKLLPRTFLLEQLVGNKCYYLIQRWICPYISRHLLSLNPLLARCRRYSLGER
ncbi:hypothetical protein GSE87_22580 [Escherichia coli]|nr:hypothetical protein [Escherichia coli]